MTDRFWEKVDVGHPLGCWEWRGGLSGGGYGVFASGPRKPNGRLTVMGAHRYAFRELRGFLPDGPLDHLCRNRPCVNPDHLEPVTSRENYWRGAQGRVAPHRYRPELEQCKRGHTDGYRRPDNGRWYCQECYRIGKRARRRGLSRDEYIDSGGPHTQNAPPRTPCRDAARRDA